MAKKKLLMLIGGECHPFHRCADIVREILEGTGRYDVLVTTDANALKKAAISRFDGVIFYTGGAELTRDQESGLAGFVKGGGAFIGIHSAAASFAGNADYVEMLGGTFASHGPVFEFPVSMTGADSPITRRIQPFRVTDELYLLKKFDPKSVTVLATAMWKGKCQPIAYTKTYGKGNVFYIALGHDDSVFVHPEFQKMLRRGVDWALGHAERRPLKVGVIGYGKSFKMGKLHLESMRAAGLEVVAVCDLVEDRLAEAREEFPGISTYRSSAQMIEKSGLELVTVITEHNVHSKLAIQCLNAGCHVVTEKPFCITVKEADAMIAAAKKNRRMLSVFHNRRWDGDYMAIRNVINAGLIGEVFQIEAAMSGYGHPSYWWRSDKPVSGGAFYDWGAHIVDWTLGLVPAKVTEVCGHFQFKRVWHDVTNEDHCSTVIRFSNGCSAHIELSQIAAIAKPRWRILGTLGAILDKNDEAFQLVSYQHGTCLKSKVKYMQSDWHAYYRNVADHLLLGEPLAVTPESARRVIAVIEASEKASRAGKSLQVPKHCE